MLTRGDGLDAPPPDDRGLAPAPPPGRATGVDHDAAPVLPPGFWQTFPTMIGDSPGRAQKGLVARATFDSDAFPEGERAAAYQHLVGGTARMTAVGGPFRVQSAWYSLGDVRVCIFDNVPHRFERSLAKLSFDQVDKIAIQHLVRGSAFGSFDGRPMEAEEGSVYGIDFARPATIEERGAVRLVLVTIERATAARVLPDLGALHGLVLSPAAASPYLRRLYALVQDLDTLSAARAHAAAADLIASLASCLGATAADDGTDDRWSAKRRAASAFIDAHIADRKLTPDRIADGLRISRSHLFAAFRDQGGVERAIIDRRLDHARLRLLSAGSRPSVGQLAEACGFSSPEHLTRLFRAKFGVAPSRFGAATPAEGRKFDAGSVASR